MQVLLGHAQLGPDAVEAQLAVGALEGEGMGGGDLPAVHVPLIHPPEVRVPQIDLERVHELRDERKLLRRADRPADTGRPVLRGLLPGFDVFEGLGQVEACERIVEHDLEARPGQPQHFLRRQPRGLLDEILVQGGVVPPLRRNHA